MLRRATKEAAGASPQRGDTTPEEKRQIPNAVLLASYIEIILCPIASPPLGPQNILRIRSSNLTEQMMDKISGSIFLYAAVAVLLAGCQRQEAPSALSKEEPRQTVIADATSVPQLPMRDPSLPDAATVLAAEDTAEKAKPTQEAELQQKPAAQVDMTKAEEAKAMPPSSQANDQSTTTLDKKGTAESASR
jgi:hypothetical protein